MTQDKDDPKHVQAGIDAARAVFDYSTRRDVWVKAVFDFAIEGSAYIYLEEPSGIVYGPNRVRIEHVKEIAAPVPEGPVAPGESGESDAAFVERFFAETTIECGLQDRDRIESLARCATQPPPPPSPASAPVAWRSMDSAPKDGSRIFAWFPFGERTDVVCWSHNAYEGQQNWTLDSGESAVLTYDPPNAWMPLPAPPIEEPRS